VPNLVCKEVSSLASTCFSNINLQGLLETIGNEYNPIAHQMASENQPIGWQLFFDDNQPATDQSWAAILAKSDAIVLNLILRWNTEPLRPFGIGPSAHQESHGFSNAGVTQYYAGMSNPFSPPPPPVEPADSTASPLSAPPPNAELERKLGELERALMEERLKAEGVRSEVEREKKSFEEQRKAKLIAEENETRRDKEMKKRSLERLLKNLMEEKEYYLLKIKQQEQEDENKIHKEMQEREVRLRVEEQKMKIMEDLLSRERQEMQEKEARILKEKQATLLRARCEKYERNAILLKGYRPIAFHDAIGRLFDFPYASCLKWEACHPNATSENY